MCRNELGEFYRWWIFVGGGEKLDATLSSYKSTYVVGGNFRLYRFVAKPKAEIIYSLSLF